MQPGEAAPKFLLCARSLGMMMASQVAPPLFASHQPQSLSEAFSDAPHICCLVHLSQCHWSFFVLRVPDTLFARMALAVGFSLSLLPPRRHRPFVPHRPSSPSPGPTCSACLPSAFLFPSPTSLAPSLSSRPSRLSPPPSRSSHSSLALPSRASDRRPRGRGALARPPLSPSFARGLRSIRGLG